MDRFKTALTTKRHVQKAFFALYGIEELREPKCIEERRTRQSVQTVERNAKFLSSPTEADRYTAENAILNEDHHEDIRLISSIFVLFAHFFLPLTLMIISRTHTLHKIKICQEILCAAQFLTRNRPSSRLPMMARPTTFVV